MIRIKNLSYCLLLIIFSLLSILPVQSQSSEIEVTLTWSTNTYIPLDYPGKSLPSEGSMIEIVANIDSKGIDPQNLTYNWFIDNKLQENNSGLGKDVFKYKLERSINKEYGIRLEVENEEKNLFSSFYILIEPVEPDLTLETKSDLSESSNPPQEYQVFTNQEIKFIAQPYFFNINNLNELSYDWSLNGESASQISNDTPNTLVIKIGQISQSISQKLTVWVENKNNSLQRAKTETSITFIP